MIFSGMQRCSTFLRRFSSDASNQMRKRKPVLCKDSLNPTVKKVEYAVRGGLYLKAKELEQVLKTANHNMPFDRLIYCHIGNPQGFGQKPISFARQLLSLVNNPDLITHKYTANIFPSDMVERAKYVLKEIGGTGAYTETQGMRFVRDEIARFISTRDGYPSNPEDIFLTNGASPAVQLVMRIMIRSSRDGILVPIPQYPLYSASIHLSGGEYIGYTLDEENGWGMHIEELKETVDNAREEGTNVRALAVINPGNPTGQCLLIENMREVVRFCIEEHLVLVADEVYQENIWHPGRTFHSFKKVVMEMGEEAEGLELFSFHSVSKGFFGECGRRGGYMEMMNISDGVKDELYKLSSIDLCSNADGQIMMSCMVNPPMIGDESYSLYMKEKLDILQSLQRRARMISQALNQLSGISCNEAEAALYVFPQVTLSDLAIEKAIEVGQAPDTYYCLALLEQTGICVVPGSGFGQKVGTFHFRTTILPPEDDIKYFVEKFTIFHQNFLSKHQAP